VSHLSSSQSVSTLWWPPPPPPLLPQALPPLDELFNTPADHAPIEAGASLVGASDHHAKLGLIA
jgi:hypothetical protein